MLTVMEPVTHFLTGACLARAGLNRKAAYATLAMTLAAEAPDLDVFWSFDGPVAGFQHHRGWTHTFLGIPFEAAIIVGVIWLLHRWRTKRGKTTFAPVRWRLLWFFCLIALASHILLDWTNNYGVRPFFPFNPHWYAGSFVFIVEPVILLMLVIGLAAPSLFNLINSEVGARPQRFRGRGWAASALVGVVLLWSWRAVEHSKAINLAAAGHYHRAPSDVLRIFASPAPINPYSWHVVVETPSLYQFAQANTFDKTITTNSDDILYKAPATPATLAAKRSWLGEVYLDWSLYPIVSDIGLNGEGFHEVTFRDARFLNDTLLTRGSNKAPLGAVVYVDQEHRVRAMMMGRRQQH